METDTEPRELKTVDDYLKRGKAFGKFQITWSCLSLFILIFVGANMVASVFEALEPNTRCVTPEEKFVTERCGMNWSSKMQKMVNPEKNKTNSGPYHCYRYHLRNPQARNCSLWHEHQQSNDENTSMPVLFSSESVSPCTEWAFNKNVMRNTIVTDFQLVCRDKWGAYIAQSALMFGVGLGSMLSGIISDRFGRRSAFLASCIGSAIVGTSLCFVPSYLVYCALRTMLGFFVYNSFPILFVLDAETTTPKYRPLVSQILECGFPFGFIFLSAVSFALREWRKIQLVLSLPFLIGVIMWWYATSCVYYGLTLNAGEIGGNPFSNMCWIAVAEIVAVIITLPALNIIGRRITGSASTICAGILCVLTVLVPSGIAPIAIVGKFAISVSFHAMYIHTSEILPTSVRSTGVGICSAMARVGGVVSPLIALTEMIEAHIPYILFGVTAVISGILVLTLPETLGVKLPQNTEDGEELFTKQHSVCKRIKQSSTVS